MGRPDLTAVRSSEILDAFARCVARYGLEGSSLERVAEEAGMKRSIIRHYIGNRDDLVRALADRVIARYRARLEAFLQDAAGDKPIDQLLDFFFPAEARESTESVLVVEALIAAGEQFPEVTARMLEYVDDLIASTAGYLRRVFLDASRPRCWETAYGVVSICFNQESLSPLGLPPKYLRAARSSARRLMESLDSRIR